MYFVFSQIFGAIALILVSIGYFAKDKIRFLFFNLIANFFYALSFIFVGSLIAGVNTFISMARIITFYLYERGNKQIPIYFMFLFFTFYIISGIVFFKNYIDIIPIITSIMFTFAMWLKDIEKVKYAMLPPNILITIYAILCKAYVTSILDFLESVIIIIAIINMIHQKKKNNNINSE